MGIQENNEYGGWRAIFKYNREADGGVDSSETIEQDLERMREKLYKTIGQRGFRLSADEVLSVSRRIDELILKFYKERDRKSTERSFPY